MRVRRRLNKDDLTMNKRLSLITAVALLTATTAFADGWRDKTIKKRDGFGV